MGTRVDLAREKGEYLELTCKQCGSAPKYHVDELKAKPSRLAHIVALVIFLVGTPLMFMVLREPLQRTAWLYALAAIVGLLLVPVTVYGLIMKDDRTRVSTFNRHKLKGRPATA
jgi:hypothetical protein